MYKENKPDDTLVFYYSGHGVPDKFGATFLAPSDSDSDHPFMKGFSFLDLTNSMLACNSLRVVTILDSCYSGSLELSKGLDSKSGEEAATRIANKKVEEKGDKLKQGVGRCLLASSQGYEEAYDRMEKAILSNKERTLFITLVLSCRRIVIAIQYLRGQTDNLPRRGDIVPRS